MEKQFSIQSALIAGFVATIAMTAFTYMAPLMGFEMNIPKMLAGTMGASIIVGWMAHFMVGLILAINYGAIFLSITKRVSDFKTGALFGILPWLFAQLMMMPMMSVMNGGSFTSGLFSGSIMLAMASLVGHLIYGAILGAMYKPQIMAAGATV